MRRAPLALALLALLVSPLQADAGRRIPAPTGLTAGITGGAVTLRWDAVTDDDVDRVVVYRNGTELGGVVPPATTYADTGAEPGATYVYTVAARASWGNGKHHAESRPSAPAHVTLPAYKVGAAAFDISPDLVGLGTIRQGGNGIGDGSTELSRRLGQGSTNRTTRERIKTRAVVFDDGRSAIALATIETQGYFAAYRDELKGLADMAAAAAMPRMPKQNVLIASDHTHSGPDTIGAWGGMPRVYFDLVYDRTVAAIRTAYEQRAFADVVAGHSAAYDLIYNQSCPEALHQSHDSPAPEETTDLPCPTGSARGTKGTDGKDGLVRVVQARTPGGAVVVTFMAFAAHATAGGGDGVHGDWPQFLGDAMAARYGGVGMAMQGAVGKTQPCRPHCAFTDPGNPGFSVTTGRKDQLVANYLAHVTRALGAALPVRGPVAAAQTRIREVVTSPAVLALFAAGGTALGARLLRSMDPPWMNGTTISTVAAALRVGDVLFSGTPGEGYPEIAFGIRDGVSGAREVITLGLANDQIGYLIAPAAAYPVITAQVAVNDNTIFNVSPTIGDHVMCADIRLARAIGFGAGDPRLAAYCAPYDAADLAGDPVGTLPVGGVSADEL